MTGSKRTGLGTGIGLGLAAALTLAGCGGDRTVNQQNGADPKIRIANQYHEDLLRLTPGNQRLAMMRAIRDNRYTCQRVDNAGYQEEYSNMRMWVAVCGEEDKTFAVYLAANGDVQVRDCADAGTLSLPRCQGLPPPVPDDTLPKFEEGAADKAYRNEF